MKFCIEWSGWNDDSDTFDKRTRVQSRFSYYNNRSNQGKGFLLNLELNKLPHPERNLNLYKSVVQFAQFQFG